MSGIPTPAFKDRFSSLAGNYATFRPRYPRELIDYLAGIADRRSLAWDCGCGSGQLSVSLAERFDRVVATDASAEQIAKATPHPRIEYRVAPAEASGLTDAGADLVTVAQAAHWFDLPKFHAEARRVAAPGAVVALICYGVHSIDHDLDPIVRRFYGDTLAPFWGPERRHVEEGYRSLPFPFQEFAAPPMELRANWTLPEMLGYISTWSAVWAMVKSQGRDTLDAFTSELSSAWGPPSAAKDILWPLSMRIGRV